MLADGFLWRHAIIVGKSIIQQQAELSVAQFEARISRDFQTEKLAAYINTSFSAFTKKWEPLKLFLSLNPQGHGNG